MTRWIPNPSSGDATVGVSWAGVLKSGRWTHDLVYYPDDTEATAPDQWAILHRIACYVLVDQLPDRGLEEALESLKSTYEFYSMPPLTAKQISARAIPTRAVPAKRGRTLMRPSVTVEADEI